MRSKTLILTCLLGIFLTSAAAQSYQHDIRVKDGDTEKVDDYIFQWDTSGSETYFEIGEEQADTVNILEQIESDEMYRSEGETFELDDNLTARIDNIGWDDGRYADLTLISSQDIFSGVKLTSSAPRKVIVSQGDEVSISLTLENMGLINQTFQIRDNSSLNTSFSYQGFEVREVYVASGEEVSISADINLSEDMELGKHSVEFVAWNSSKASEKILLDVRESTEDEDEKEGELEVDVEQLYKQVQPGETTTIQADFANHGESDIRDINVTAVSPEGWSHSVESDLFSLSGRGYDREMVPVTIEVPPNVEAGDYVVEISADAENTGTDQPKEVRLHVQKKSGLSYLGAGLMAVSLLTLVFVYRKFQRR